MSTSIKTYVHWISLGNWLKSIESCFSSLQRFGMCSTLCWDRSKQSFVIIGYYWCILMLQREKLSSFMWYFLWCACSTSSLQSRSLRSGYSPATCRYPDWMSMTLDTPWSQCHEWSSWVSTIQHCSDPTPRAEGLSIWTPVWGWLIFSFINPVSSFWNLVANGLHKHPTCPPCCASPVSYFFVLQIKVLWHIGFLK